ncbi:MAG TPA: FtsX-like permease family protein, partial [Sphaerochaeta sp.]|nr:FtsX-like permease family protein [Sphaerochaeta sp.]
LAIAYTNAHLVPPNKAVKLTFLRSGKQAAVVPATRVVPVSGIYYTSSWEFDSTTLLTTLETVQSLVGTVNYHIGLYSNTAPMTLKRQLKNAGYPEIKTYHEVNAALWAAMELEQKLMVVMLLVMVVIVLVHAYSSTRRLVATKQREVAMLMTLGVPKRTITEVFILQAAIISSLGLALGVGLSYGLLALYPHLAPILYRHIGTYLVLTIQVGQLLLLIGGIFTFSLLVAYWAIRRLLSVDIMEMFVYDETT